MTRFASILAAMSIAAALWAPPALRPPALAGAALAVLVLAARAVTVLRKQRRLRTLKGLRAMPPADFEAEVARWLRRDGWQVEARGGTGDGGIDLIARHRDATLAVQCKRYAESHAVSSAQVRDLYGAALAAEATAAALVTTGRVSAPAIEWAEALPGTLTLRFHDCRCLARLADGSGRV